ncbi:filamin-A-like [Paramacrobiotus metropolitanus]|uniref:filamin-A-like n=1 Tax=Paramacrobiotus metropolitanus TaxID=2943436 RepID=UPI002446486E|nr:filamin-A-like [Paramacrobiotus metropolitanus]
MSSLRIIGFQTNVALNTLSEFLVDCRDASVGESAALKVVIHSPSGISGEALVSEKSPGLYNVSCSVFEEGPHTLSMSLDGLPVRGQPLIITAGNPTGSYSLMKNGGGLAGGQKTEDYSVSEEMSGDGTTIIRRETRLVRETVSSVCTESILGSSTSSVMNGLPSAMAAIGTGRRLQGGAGGGGRAAGPRQPGQHLHGPR